MAIIRSSFTTGKVLENKAWSERLFSLKVRADQMPFKAGQFIRLRLPVEGEPLAKSYSLVNAPDDADVEVYFNKVTDGRLSNALAALKPGDTIEVSQPANGLFVLDEIPESRHLWMIATGTGLGPYISILRAGEIWQRFEKITLVHGVPHLDELTFSEVIETWQQDRPDQFQYVSCVSREPNPTGLHGRVTDKLADGSLEKQASLEINKDNSHIMLCGNHSMINDMRTLLSERDMNRHRRHKPGHITTEQYF